MAETVEEETSEGNIDPGETRVVSVPNDRLTATSEEVPVRRVVRRETSTFFPWWDSEC